MRICEAVDPYNRRTTAHVVAYLDILGASSRINQSAESQNASLNLLHNLYTAVMDLSAQMGIDGYKDLKFKIFSDNIIIAKELRDEQIEQDVLVLLNCVSHFMCHSVGDCVGWLARGGVTIGELYIDDTIVWGTGLIRAYELEDKAAIYPRVVLDHSIVQILDKLRSDYLRRDEDGLCFLNYMSIWHHSARIIQAAFEQMKSEAIRKDGSYPERVYQKLYWHMNYINRELNLKDERKDRGIRLTI